MSKILQNRTHGAVVSSSLKTKNLNAEIVTTIATSFLKRIGHKKSIKPKRVSLEEGVYFVEVETKRLMAIVKIDAETHEIKEYEIQPKGEETSFAFFSPRLVVATFGISAVVYVMLYFAFEMIGL